jgi:hypothetical protein
MVLDLCSLLLFLLLERNTVGLKLTGLILTAGLGIHHSWFPIIEALYGQEGMKTASRSTWNFCSSLHFRNYRTTMYPGENLDFLKKLFFSAVYYICCGLFDERI